MTYQKIGFIGLGLIGGSLAKTIRKKFPEIKMIAHASREATIHIAYRDGLIENDHLLPLSEFGDCDLIFLCSPVMINIRYLEELKPCLSEHTILTDVGSVKGNIHQAADRLSLSHCFIGGHPMAGSEKVGYRYASDHLLENAYYIITPGYQKEGEALELPDFSVEKSKVDAFVAFIDALGAIPMVLSAKDHDFATAAISHLPHVVSASLVNLIADHDMENHVMKTIAAGGFKDITRISSSSPVMWQHICLSNREMLLRLLDLFTEELNSFRESILFSNDEELMKLFSSARDFRDSLRVKKAGILPKAYDFYCDLSDETGAIAKAATLLAKNGINIKNIGIIHNREYEDGALHIELYDDENRTKAIDVLRANAYTVYDGK